MQHTQPNDVVESKSHSKLVPWKLVRASLFSSSIDSLAFALQRISTWRSRGCIPVAVEIQQKDPLFSFDWRRCLLASLPSNKQLVASAVTLAQLAGDRSLIQKLKKLALLEQPSLLEPNSTGPNDETFLSKQEYSIRQAKEKLELMKRQRMMQSKHEKPSPGEVGSKKRWSVAKSWTPCPAGMLPHTIGFSGRLPTLDCVDSRKDVVMVPATKEAGSKESNGKREAEISTEKMDDTPLKRVGIEAACWRQNESDSNAEGMKGYLMIGGVWKKVEEGELFGIASAVKLMI